MRLLLINPNITQAVTDRMAAEARLSASPGTEIVAVTAAFGSEYIASRPEAAIGAHAVLDAIACHEQGCDAIIIAAFGDPGLAAARELASIPVLGLGESAMLVAWTLCRRFSIVCLSSRLRRWYIELAEEVGLAGRLGSVRGLDVAIPDIANAKEQLQARLIAECLAAVEQDGAEAVIFGGGPIAGLAREVADDIPVPVLDGVSCAVRLAEAIGGLHPRKPVTGSFARPAPKPATGLSPALLRRFTGKG